MILYFLLYMNDLYFEPHTGRFGPNNRQWYFQHATYESENLAIVDGKFSVVYYRSSSAPVNLTIAELIAAIYVLQNTLFVSTGKKIICYSLPDLDHKKTINESVVSFFSAKNRLLAARNLLSLEGYPYLFVDLISGFKFFKKPSHLITQPLYRFSFDDFNGSELFMFENDCRVFLSSRRVRREEGTLHTNIPGITPFFKLCEQPKVLEKELFAIDEYNWKMYEDRHSNSRNLYFGALQNGYVWIKETPTFSDGYLVGTYLDISILNKSLHQTKSLTRYGQFLNVNDTKVLILHDELFRDGDYLKTPVTSTDQLMKMWNPYFSNREFRPVIERLSLE
ncbi:MAG: hypothetical protein QNK37_08490 [Acidobacteriota bacterium]|nr:hypothetical protein [Acidobacteriota bacterium]